MLTAERLLNMSRRSLSFSFSFVFVSFLPSSESSFNPAPSSLSLSISPRSPIPQSRLATPLVAINQSGGRIHTHQTSVLLYFSVGEE